MGRYKVVTRSPKSPTDNDARREHQSVVEINGRVAEVMLVHKRVQEEERIEEKSKSEGRGAEKDEEHKRLTIITHHFNSLFLRKYERKISKQAG